MLINIFGPSGSGKTTFVNNLLKSEKTQLFFEQISNKKYNYDLNKKISISLIPLPKFRGSVEELFNIFSIKVESLLYLEEKLNKLSISTFKEIATEKSLKEISSRKIETFSAGETRRLFLLESLLINSELVIIDEPFSNSDQKLWEIIFEAIYSKPKSIVLSHVSLEKYFRLNFEDRSINIYDLQKIFSI